MSGKSLHSIDKIFVLILFAVFVASALFVSASGALAYKNAAEQMDERFNKQTCINYVTAKIRSNNESGKVQTGEFGGKSALLIKDNFGGEGYTTYIYQYGGSVRELTCSDEVADTMDPSAGWELTKANELAFSKEGALIKIELTDISGKLTTVYVNTISGE